MTRRLAYVSIAAILFLAAGNVAAFVARAQGQERPLASKDSNPYAAQIAALDRQLFERDNEILHLKTEWATCRASLDATELSAQATELVRRCEIATGGKCEWDNGARKVVIIAAKESK